MSLVELLEKYEPISLAEMGGIRLMNRTDTKFVTTARKLAQLLEEASGDYYAQEIDGNRVASYYTMYFDTEGGDMFRTHVCGKLNRQKLRVRSYVDSGLDFLEVKTKNNRGRTKKCRIAVDGFATTISDAQALPAADTLASLIESRPDELPAFLASYLRYDPALMLPKIENRFSRVTLVNRDKTERLTIDTGLKFHNVSTGQRLQLDNIAIIELKRDGLAPSPILERLRALRIRAMGFSKYCMGMAMTDPALSANRFKPRLRRLAKILG